MKSSCLNSTLLDDLNAVLRVANEEAPNVLVVEIGDELGVLAVENRTRWHPRGGEWGDDVHPCSGERESILASCSWKNIVQCGVSR